MTGREAHVEVKPSYGLGEDDMARMLRDSLEHARADMDARLLAEARVEAHRAHNAVRAALAVDADLVPAPELAAIEAALERVERAVAGVDRDAIAASAEALEEITKPFAERRMDRGIRAALTGKRVDQLGV